MSSYVISSGPEFGHADIKLPWSKSLVNRILMLHRIAGLPLEKLESYCDCQDSLDLFHALQSGQARICVGEGAAPYRFMLALMSAEHRRITLDASGSMLQRNISPLVDALNDAGAEIRYAGTVGNPPVIIEKGLPDFQALSIDTSVSSQFASALMLVAPLFSGEKIIHTRGKRVSEPYLKMSAALMECYGVHATHDACKAEIQISPGMYLQPDLIPLEADWSAAAFFYTLSVLNPRCSIALEGLSRPSLQGDSALPELFAGLGVQTKWIQLGGILLQGQAQPVALPALIDFSDIPDLLPAFLVACAVRNVQIKVYGVAHLAQKESNRLAMLAKNFRNMGVAFYPEQASWVMDARQFNLPDNLHVETGNDHRMAMAFATLAVIKPVVLDNIQCTAKSFPGFWDQLKKCNLSIEQHPYGV
jgi:3-phosphoshikimate 1-carboxyvinyltransferase